MIKSSVWACYYGTMWDLHHLEDLAENGGGANIANLVREVKSRLTQLMETYKEMLLNENLIFREEVNYLFDRISSVLQGIDCEIFVDRRT